MRRRINLGRVGAAAVAALAAVGSIGQVHVRNVAALRRLRRDLADVDDRLLRRAIARLERAGVVRRGRLQLSSLGERLAVSRALGIEKVSVPLAWNGRWCVVAFDVPDRLERRILRNVIRALGFALVQQSVYAHPNPEAASEAAAQIGRLGAERRIALISGGKIDGDRALRRKFGLATTGK